MSNFFGIYNPPKNEDSTVHLQNSKSVENEKTDLSKTKKQDETEDNKEKQSVRSICETFLQESGMHGVNKLQKSSRNLLRRVIWGLTLIGCLVYLVVTIKSEITNFLNRPTTTSIDIDVADSLNFPSVTVCNLSPFNKSKMKVENEKALNYYTAMYSMNYMAGGVNWSDPYYQENGYYEPESMEFMMNNISMELDKFIQFCIFNNIYQQCNHIFKPSFTSTGPCFVFNHDGQMKTGMKGESYNLILEIFIDQKNYFYGMSIGSGIKIAIHDSNDKPDMSNEGLLISPGTLTSVTITQEKHEYLPYPYKAFKNGYCLDTEDESFKNPLKYYQNYSVNNCIEECQAELIKGVANCRLLNHPGTDRVCSKFELNKYQWEFFKLFYGTKTARKCSEQCPSPCKYTTYASQISSAQFPSDFTVSEIRRLRYQNISLEYFRNNYLFLQIFYEKLITRTTRQVPVYNSWVQIFANLGGQMGLFLGASIITITEFLEFFVNLFVFLCTKGINRSNS